MDLMCATNWLAWLMMGARLVSASLVIRLSPPSYTITRLIPSNPFSFSATAGRSSIATVWIRIESVRRPAGQFWLGTHRNQLTVVDDPDPV